MPAKAIRTKPKKDAAQGGVSFRTLFESHPLPMWIYDLKTLAFLEVNEAALEKYGYSRAEFLKMTLKDIRPEEEVSRLLADVKKKRSALQHSGEWQHRLKNGRIIDVEINSHTIEFNGRKAALVTAQDITKRKQAEEKLCALSTRQEAILAAVPDILMEVDKEKVYTWANPAGIEFFGKDVLGKEAAFYFEGEQATYDQVQPLFNGDEGVFYIESWQRRKDGGKRLLAWWCRSLTDTNGNIIGALSLAHDITERKQAEEALRESEEKFKTLFNSANDAIFTMNHTTFLDCNATTEKIFRCTRDQIVGHSPVDFSPERQPDGRLSSESAVEKIEAAFAGEPQFFEWLHTHLDGTPFNAEVSLNRVFIGGGFILQAIVRDVTERKQAEDALKEYNTRLETAVEARTRELRETQERLIRQEKLAVLGQLAGGVGHELRNPLAVINNAAYYLKLVQPDVDVKIKEYLGMIERETRNADKIITDLLDFTRIKSLAREAVAVSELIRQTLERYPAPPAVEVTLELPPGLPMVFTDPQHIVQVLGNLTVNACQAMPDGGNLTLSARAQGDMISIAVRDSGVGIPPENMSKLFEPLFTTKTKGIGLGLAVSQKIAEANGGRIEVRSEPEKGSTFTLFLPIYRELE